MHIGIVMKHLNTAKILQANLSQSHEVTIYHTPEESIKAILEARFLGKTPHSLILTELDLGRGISGPEMIRCLRLFLPKSELSFILMNGRSVREEEIARQNLLDGHIRLLYKDTSTLYQEIQKAMGGRL